MNRKWQDSVILIVSSDPGIHRFGTGFAIRQDEHSTDVVTCTHVVNDVGGIDNVRAYDVPAHLIFSGEEKGIDLSVLRFQRSLNKSPLPFNSSGKKGATFITAGFQLLGREFLIRTLHGYLGEQVGIESKERVNRIEAWDLHIADDYSLQPGYSGSPVLDEQGQAVLGIVSHRQGEGEKGLAISINALQHIGQDIMVQKSDEITSPTPIEQTESPVDSSQGRFRDWGEAPDVSIFFGRTEEIHTLKDWIVDEQCRLVAILGLRGIGKTRLSLKLSKGGIGKTDLSLKLAHGIQEEFEYIIWRRLLNAPPVYEILADIIKFLSSQQEVELPQTIDGQISRVLSYLQDHRCLLIIDNVEAILHGGEQSGQYREGYEDYGKFFQQIGECLHQSCLLLTSREKPPEVAILEGKTRPVRSLELAGLDEVAGHNIFTEFGSFSGSDEEWKELIDFYNGNPLALELAAKHINDVFFGDISTFLQEGKPVFSDLRDLLDWHFERLSEFEKEIMYWLAIDREPVSLSELKEDIVSPLSKEHITSTLQSLQRRLPLERSNTRFTLQPVLIEYMTERLIGQVGIEIKIGHSIITDYMTERFVEKISEEIQNGRTLLLNSHALLKALAKDYVRESQVRLILTPVIEKLVANLGNHVNVEKQLLQIILTLQEKFPQKSGYTAGNILNLLVHLQSDLSNSNFSALSVWQAYLQGTELHNVNFTHSIFFKTRFTQAFGNIVSVAISPDNKFLAATDNNGFVCLWQMTDFRQLWKAPGHSSWVWSVTFSPDSKLLATGSDDLTIKLWDVQSGECKRTLLGHTNSVWSVTFSPDGHMLASSSSDQTIKFWKIFDGTCCKTLQEHTNWIRSIAFHPYSQTIASVSGECSIRIWDVTTGECLKVLKGHTDRIRSIAFAPNGKLLVSGSADQTVKVWDVDEEKELYTLHGHSDKIWAVKFSPDSNIIASSSADHSIRLWDTQSKKCFNTLLGHTNSVWSIAFSPNGFSLASGSEDQTVRLWNTQNGKCLATLQGYRNWTCSVAFSHNSQLLASGHNDQHVRLWSLVDGKCVKILKGHSRRVWAVAFSPDKRILASGSEDTTVRLWDINTGRCVNTLKGVNDTIWSIAFSSDGQLLASAGKSELITMWKVTCGEYLKTLHEHNNAVWSIAFSPDSRLLASGNEDNTVRIWDVQTGKCLYTLKGHSKWVRSLDFSLNGRFVVSGGGDGDVRIWDVQNGGKCVKVLQRHSGWICSVTFSPDSRLIASGGQDNVLKVWNIETGECIYSLEGFTDRIWSTSFSPNNEILAASQDNVIILWDMKNKKYLDPLRVPRPYEGMNITAVMGLTEGQKNTLKTLGAVEN